MKKNALSRQDARRVEDYVSANRKEIEESVSLSELTAKVAVALSLPSITESNVGSACNVMGVKTRIKRPRGKGTKAIMREIAKLTVQIADQLEIKYSDTLKAYTNG